MGILDKVKSAVSSGVKGAVTVSKGLASVAGSLANTTGKIASFVTGGPREQSYGYFSEYFQNNISSVKQKRKDRPITQIRGSIKPTNLAPVPQYGTSTEALNNIFDFMKRTQERQIRQLEVQNSFIEGRTEADKQRHEELLRAIRDFVKVKTVTATRVGGQTEETGPNIFDSLMKFMTGALEQLKKMAEGALNLGKKLFESLGGWDTIKKILNFAINPATFLASGGLLLSAFSAAIASDPNFRKAFRDNFMLNAVAGDAAIGANIMDVAAKDERERKLVDNANATKSSLLKDTPWYKKMFDVGARDYLINEKGLTPEEADFLMPGNQLNEDKFGNIKDREQMLGNIQQKAFGFAGARSSDEARNAPKIKPIESSTAGAGRGGADLASTDTRRVDRVSPSPTTPVSAPVARVIDENHELEAQQMVKPMTNKPIVMKNNSSQSVNEAPLPSTALQRDEEPMADFIFTKQRNQSRAY